MSRDTFATAPVEAPDEVLVVDTRPGSEGQRFYVPTTELDRAVRDFGVRVATEDEAVEADRARILGSGAGATAAGAIAAQDELSLGGTSRALADAGAGDIGTELAERNPNATLAGTVGGALALGAATTGLGTALGAGRATTALARAGRGFAEGATAGAAGGAALLQRQLAADPNAPLTAERLAGTVGVSALLGGGLGGTADVLLSGAGALGRRALTRRAPAAQTREAVEATAERVLGRTPEPGVADRFLRLLGLSDEQRQFAGRALRPDADGADLRRAIDAGRSGVDEATTSLRTALDDLDQITRTTEDFSRGELKRGQMRRLVRDDTVDAVAEEGAAAFQSVRGLAQAVADDGAVAGGKALSRRMVRMLDEYEQQFAAAIQAGGRDGATDALIALDKMKRALGAETQTVIGSRNLQIVGQEFENAYEQIRVLLERDDLFGGAAAAQREINEAWSGLIPRRREFNASFRRRSGEQEGFRALQSADTAKLNAWLNQTGTARAGSADDLFEGFLADQARFIERVGKHYDLPEGLQGSIAQAQQTTQRLRDTLGRVRTEVGASNQLRELSEALGTGTGGILSGAIGGAVGAAGGVAGVGVGALAGLAMRPDRLIRMIAAVERTGIAFRARQTTATKGLVASLTGGARRVPSARALRNAGVALSAREVASRFNDAVKTLSAQDPQAMADRLSSVTSGLGDVAPDVAAHVGATAVRGVTYLQGLVPPGAVQPPTFGAPELGPSDLVPEDEQRAFLRAAAVVDDPLVALDEAARGTLTREQVEALWAVYPALAQSMTTEVVEEITSLGRPLPYEGRVRVSLLLGVPSDPSLAPMAILRSQQTYQAIPLDEAAAEEEPLLAPSSRRPPEVASGFQSQSQRLAARG